MKTLTSFVCAAALLVTPVFAEAPKPAAPGTPPAAAGTVVTPDEVAKLIAEKKVTVLDIRTPDEFAAGHIAGAMNIDFMDDSFAKKIAALDKSKTYVVHCAGGGRSGRSLPTLEKEGLKSVLHLQQGFKGWQGAGKPIEKN
jgi:rhodanese-related sulfurtransferase